MGHMNEYIEELEKRLKNEEHRLYQKQVKLKKQKSVNAAGLNKKIRDQQNEIELLRSMVSGR